MTRRPAKARLSNAERQARYRARRLAAEGAPVIRIRRAVDRRSRPQRWRAAVANCSNFRRVYSLAWMGSPPACTAARRPEALQAVADLDLEALAAIEPPRGYWT